MAAEEAAAAVEVPVTAAGFDTSWAKRVLTAWLLTNEKRPEDVIVRKVEPSLNSQQGLLSTTFILDITYSHKDEEEEKSLFVKVPLRGDAGAPFKQVNVREYEMYRNVLPTLLKFLQENCTGFFSMGVPEVIYCHYEGDEKHDVFILENLMASGFVTCVTSDLKLEAGGGDYLKSTLETLSQLHGTGLVYTQSVGGRQEVLNKFPNIEEQIQVKDLLSSKTNRIFLRTHFGAFIRYLEELDPDLQGITQYLKKMDTYLFKILQVLDESGVGNLNTLCHGDAKPNNFMFRKISLDFEEEELTDLSCEGVESMLIDWQGGFLGSICNDLMWCVYPFLEVNSHDQDLYNLAFQHYYQELKNVLDTFGKTLEDFKLPQNLADFRSLIRRGFVLEFLIVTVLRPVLHIKDPVGLIAWHKKLLRHEKRKAKGGMHKFLAGKSPKLPEQETVFQNPRYLEFLQFYFKIATSLGAFQELGLIYFELMKDAMFGEGRLDGFENDIPKKPPRMFSKEWMKTFVIGSCVKAQTNESDEYTKAKKENPSEEENKNTKCLEKENIIYADQEIENEGTKTQTESIYEEVTKLPLNQEVETTKEETVTEDSPKVERVRQPTPPDPLRTLAAELHASFLDYKETFSEFQTLMDRNKPPDVATNPPEDEAIQQKEYEKQNTATSSVEKSGQGLSKETKERYDKTSNIKDDVKNTSASSFKNDEGSAYKGSYHGINLDTPLTLRKISREVVYSEQRVQETISFLTSEKSCETSFVESSEKRRQRHNILEGDDSEFRKDSFCSDITKEDLIGLLDEDEAAWEEESNEQAMEEKPVVSTVEESSNCGSTKKEATPDKKCLNILENGSKVAVSSEKSSILAWLNLTNTGNNSEEISGNKEESIQPPVSLLDSIQDSSDDNNQIVGKDEKNGNDSVQGEDYVPPKSLFDLLQEAEKAESELDDKKDSQQSSADPESLLDCNLVSVSSQDNNPIPPLVEATNSCVVENIELDFGTDSKSDSRNTLDFNEDSNVQSLIKVENIETIQSESKHTQDLHDRLIQIDNNPILDVEGKGNIDFKDISNINSDNNTIKADKSQHNCSIAEYDLIPEEDYRLKIHCSEHNVSNESASFKIETENESNSTSASVPQATVNALPSLNIRTNGNKEIGNEGNVITTQSPLGLQPLDWGFSSQSCVEENGKTQVIDCIYGVVKKKEKMLEQNVSLENHSNKVILDCSDLPDLIESGVVGSQELNHDIGELLSSKENTRSVEIFEYIAENIDQTKTEILFEMPSKSVEKSEDHLKGILDDAVMIQENIQCLEEEKREDYQSSISLLNCNSLQGGQANVLVKSVTTSSKEDLLCETANTNLSEDIQSDIECCQTDSYVTNEETICSVSTADLAPHSSNIDNPKELLKNIEEQFDPNHTNIDGVSKEKEQEMDEGQLNENKSSLAEASNTNMNCNGTHDEQFVDPEEYRNGCVDGDEQLESKSGNNTLRNRSRRNSQKNKKKRKSKIYNF